LPVFRYVTPCSGSIRGEAGHGPDRGSALIDEAEIAKLYERFGHALYRRCLRLLGNTDDAHELVQEVFLQFWRGRERFEGRSSPFTYLYRIATNQSIDRLRRRKTAGQQVQVEDAGAETANRMGPDRQAGALLDLAELTRGLDEETLTVAVMSHVDGLTQDEIALALDLSRRTIGKRLKRFHEHTSRRAQELGKTVILTAAEASTHGD
jgi:RNA polymerase sigma-70 factor (ECF subfamily)